jgi:hypothetical protein
MSARSRTLGEAWASRPFRTFVCGISTAAIFGMDHVWQANVPPQAIAVLTKSMNLKPIAENQVPADFWKMPPEYSDLPSWWHPKPIEGAEYYMSPTFVPHLVENGRLDGVVMYNPADELIYVWSQFDY